MGCGRGSSLFALGQATCRKKSHSIRKGSWPWTWHQSQLLPSRCLREWASELEFNSGTENQSLTDNQS
jgi:hypothetical protein